MKSVKLVGGTWGAIATGLFAGKAPNRAGADGFFLGNPEQVLARLTGVAALWILAGGATFVLLKFLDGIMKIRVTDEEEEIDLDLTRHLESGYPNPPGRG